MKRCSWGTHESMQEYHDNEWGKVTKDEKVLYEFLVLESAQAGLSWSTILKRREGYRKAYDNFDYEKIANYDTVKIGQLKNDTRIIRNRLKVESSINNAKRFIEVQKEFGSFYNYIWHFTDYKQIDNKWEDDSLVPASTPLSDEISKDMKKRGFKFIGTTIIYSYIQAIGVVNDHIINCDFR